MNFLLDFLFPKRCVSCGKLGAYICKKCFSEIEFIKKPLCPICQRQAIGGRTHPGCGGRYQLDGLIVVCRYRGAIAKAVQKIKYKWVYDIGKILVSVVAGNLWKFDFPPDATLVPVPLHIKRKRWRGFNQAELIGQDLARRFKHPYSDLLVRNRYTRPQVELKSDKRKENVRSAFSLRPIRQAQGEQVHGKPLNFDIRDKNILLVDDVYTSGATMSECCKVLKRVGAKDVWGLAVALG